MGYRIVTAKRDESVARTSRYVRKTNPTDVADTSTPDRLASGDDAHHRLRMRCENAQDSAQDGKWAEVHPQRVVDTAEGIDPRHRPSV